MILVGNTLATFLALVLVAAAIHKAVAPKRLAIAAANLARSGEALGYVFIAVAGAVELFAAMALVIPATRTTGALLAAALWVAYAVMLLAAARRGASFDCGCTLFATTSAPGRFALLRASLLAALAAGVVTIPVGPWTVDVPFAALALFSLYIAAGELAAIPQPRWRSQ